MALTVDQIITITQGGILYRDDEGTIGWVDFKLCNETWADSYLGDDEDRFCVGWRNTGKDKMLDVEFFTLPDFTRFVFTSFTERDMLLLNPIKRKGGWYTKDLSLDSGLKNRPYPTSRS